MKLFVEGVPGKTSQKEGKGIAAVTMILENMQAVGGASHGNLFLLVFSLALSIPILYVTGKLLSMLMDYAPFIVYIGSADRGRMGG